MLWSQSISVEKSYHGSKSNGDLLEEKNDEMAHSISQSPSIFTPLGKANGIGTRRQGFSEMFSLTNDRGLSEIIFGSDSFHNCQSNRTPNFGDNGEMGECHGFLWLIKCHKSMNEFVALKSFGGTRRKKLD